MNYLYLLLILEGILLIFVASYTKLDLTSPSFITITMFLLSTVCIILNEEYWDVHFLPKTYFAVFGGLFLIAILEFFIKRMTYRKNVWIDQQTYIARGSIYFDFGVKILFLTITTIFSLIYIVSVIRTGGQNSGNLLGAISIVHTDEEASVGLLATICVRMMRLICYPCLYYLTYNVIVCREKLISNIWLLLVILEAFLVIFFSGVRSTYLYYIFAGVFYTVMLQRFKKGWREVKLKNYIKPIAIFLGIFVAVFIGSRTIVKGHDFTSTEIEYFTFYLGRPLHLFNKIIDDTTAAFPTHYNNILGAHTFKWFYQELYKFGLISTNIEATNFSYVGGGFYGGGNVYTMFSYALHDFGYIGMYIYIALLYFIYDWIYYKKFKYSSSITTKGVTLMVFGSFYYIILMTFYGALTNQMKLQTILETLIMVVIFKYLPKLRCRKR